MAVNSVVRALQIIEMIAQHEEGLKMNDVIRTLDLPKSTGFNLLKTLTSKGYLRMEEDTKRYKIGIKSFQIGTSYFKGFDLPREAQPELKRLTIDTAETVNLAIFTDSRAVFAESVTSSETIYWSNSPRSNEPPLHCTGVGKLFLANLTQEEFDKIIDAIELTRFTEKTIVTVDALHKDLSKTADRGYSIDDEEYQLGVRCVALPIYNYTNRAVAAVSISSPSGRLTDKKIPTIANRIRESTKCISKLLGWEGGNVG